MFKQLSYNKEMLLAIDVGNTAMALGFFVQGKIVRRSWIKTNDIRKLKRPKGIHSVIIASVVPRADKILRRKFKNSLFVNAHNIPMVLTGTRHFKH